MSFQFHSKYPPVRIIDVAPLTNDRVLSFERLRTYIPTAEAGIGEILGGVEVNFENRPSRADVNAQPGDVLFARMQGTIKVLLVDKKLSEYIYSTGFAVFHPTKKILSKYLYYWLVSSEFNLSKDTLCTGATQKAISNGGIAKLIIPLPPLAEQERLVRQLDEADQLRRLRALADARLADLIPALFHKMFGDPAVNEKGWKTKPLRELLTRIDSGWSPVCLDRPAEQDEWGMLKLGAVTYCEYDDSQNKAFPKELNPRPELEVKAGDVLFSRKNTHDLVAACAFVYQTRPRLMLSDLTFRFRIRDYDELLPEYLWRVMISPNKRKKIQMLATGSAAQMPNISKSRLHTVEIPLPPLVLQREFSAYVAELRLLQTQQVKSKERLNALFESILAMAFSGAL